MSPMRHVPIPSVAAGLALSLSACVIERPSQDGTPRPETLVVAEGSADRLREHMAVLASDEMEGRETGTPGFDRAAMYVAGQLRALGLRPGADAWRQSMTIRRTQVDEAGTSLTVQVGPRVVAFTYGTDLVTYGVRGGAENMTVTGALVSAGDGVSVPDRSVDAYRDIDVRGKIVVLTSGAPASLSDSERSFYGDETQKVTAAAARGARAVLLVDEPQIPWPVRLHAARQLGTSETDPLPTANGQPIPLFYVSQPAAARLLGAAGVAGGPRPAAPDAARATLRLRQHSREVPSANIVGILPGTDSRVAREHVVVMAHCDHVGVGAPVNGDVIYNGAVDNASGVAALLEIARALTIAPPARSFVFLCTTGEEQGLIGSRYFVAHRDSMPGPIVAAINIDGTSIQSFTSLEVRGGSNSSLGAAAEAAARRIGLQVVQEPLGVGGSDHAPFLLAGIPPVWIGATLPPDWMATHYHTPQDDMQQPIDFDAVARYTHVVAALASLVGVAPAPPAWRPGEFFAVPRRPN